MNNIFGFLVGFGFIIGVFIVFRELVMWYWKINRVVELLEQIEKNTRKNN